MRSDSGLSLLETVVAIAICGIILAALSTTTMSGLQQSNSGNHRTQATQILDTVGRRIAGDVGQPINLATGEVVSLSGSEVDELMNLSAFREAAFEVHVHNVSVFSLGSTRLSEYRIEVCYVAGGQDSCVSGATLGRLGGS